MQTWPRSAIGTMVYHPQKDWLTCLHLTVLSMAFWVAFWFLNKLALNDTLVTTGINLVYVPAGIRLILVLLFGFWGALGVFLADPILFFVEFGSGTPREVIVNAAISGFGPYIAVKGACRLAGISHDLSGLDPWHLPVLALVVSLSVPLLFNLHFLANGRHPFAEFERNYVAMATGDFLGCFVVLMAARGLIWIYRSAKSADGKP